MYFRYILALTLGISVLWKCKSQQYNADREDEIYKIVNLRLKNFNNEQIYFKSYAEAEYNISFLKTYLNSYACHRAITISDSYDKKLAKIESIKGISRDSIEQLLISLSKENMVEKKWVEDNIPEQEANEIAKNFEENPVRWNREKIMDYSQLVGKKEGLTTVSIPAFNDSNTLSLLLVKFPNSLQAEIYRKQNNSWYLYCSFLISSSD